ncbi:ATP-dependent dethiobiotin synthetase BioD [Pigmentiphaga humi]|uniref:ATP-dependent dethiobiotin synthetase BioD n=1 Tax=Pigmentiphaga humi TaxID=2478468 RepID=A0A3P4B9P4_9BURK|nr:dethiobiotin synthase [Pigmentiphaga humi]VCU72458.1 ATP-dependent dethiobiotin synthetase BioD [Pigmentiphaga humi]
MRQGPGSHERIAARFGTAAHRYDSHAGLQRDVAAQLAERIAKLPLPAYPRILEIGCGTGALSAELARRIGPARWLVTDISADMLAMAQRRLDLPGESRFAIMNGEHPEAGLGQFDLVCSSMAVQWFGDLDAGLARLAGMLAPGGWLAVATLAADTFQEWRAAHAAHGVDPAVAGYPRLRDIGTALPACRRTVEGEHRRQRHAGAMAFLRELRAIGADTPPAAARPLPAGTFRRVLETFEQMGASVTYHLAYGTWQRPSAPRGVFVTGTDTGIGKTLVSAVLAHAWNADYWKPLQTGVASEPDDSGTVAALSGLPDSRIHPPHAVLQAPLSPWAAALEEGAHVDLDAIVPPSTDAPLVVEGAGGLLVPINDQAMMIDLIARLGLPVVLVARSALGTLNHTLLSLEALRARGIPVAGVVMSGERSPGNRTGIEQFGKVRVLAEIPLLPRVDAHAVEELARAMPGFEAVLAQMAAPTPAR